MRREIIARLALLLIGVGLPLSILGYQFNDRQSASSGDVVHIEAKIPEEGGFDPADLQVAVGQKVTLRFAASDVTHGIAIGPGLGVDTGPIYPGHVEDVMLTFDKPGTYTYYCTTWCSPNHWRMRGTIRVYDPQNLDAYPTPWHDPVIVNLAEEGVDIDAVHNSDMGAMEISNIVFDRTPSVERGADLIDAVVVPNNLGDVEWRRTHTPQAALSALKMMNPTVAEADLIDVVVYLWVGELDTEGLSSAKNYYNNNCAACHGQTGNGNGPAAALTVEDPIVFNDLNYLFMTRGDVLYAKIRRGGMGTDMPNFGTLLTTEETWRIVEYVRTLPLRE
jgi:plastocyanin/mono/diheme cytochrome c family protein